MIIPLFKRVSAGKTLVDEIVQEGRDRLFGKESHNINIVRAGGFEDYDDYAVQVTDSEYSDYNDSVDRDTVMNNFQTLLIPEIESRGNYSVTIGNQDEFFIYYTVLNRDTSEESFVARLWKAEAFYELTTNVAEYATGILENIGFE